MKIETIRIWLVYRISRKVQLFPIYDHQEIWREIAFFLYAHRLAGLLYSLGTSFLIVWLYSIWSEINRFVIGSSELTHDQYKVGTNSFNVGVVVIANKEAAKNRQFLPAAKPSRYSNCEFFSECSPMFKKKPKTATLTSENVSMLSTGHEKIYGNVICGLGGHLEAEIASKYLLEKI